MFVSENALGGQPPPPKFQHNPHLGEDVFIPEHDISHFMNLDHFPSGPENALLLGMCEDGLPLFMDLEDHSAGALILIGDNTFGNQSHLTAILNSACELNQATDVNLHIITRNPGMFEELSNKPHFMQVYQPYDEASWILIEEICDLVAHRQKGLPAQPIQILVIDDLALLIQDFSAKQLEDFKWLLGNSAEARVWVIATLTSTNIHQDYFAIIKNFGSKAFGRVNSPTEAAQLTGSSFQDITELIPGVESVVRSGEDQFKIYISKMRKPTQKIVSSGVLK